MRKIFLLGAILIMCSSCSEFALLMSGSIDVLTIMKTEKDIKRHIYDTINSSISKDLKSNENKK